MKEYLQKLKELITVEPDNAARRRQDYRAKALAGCFLCFVSVILTVMNIVKGYTFMACTTGVLIIGFAVAVFLIVKFKQLKAGDILMAVMCALNFSVYAITGENEGFACLWILLMPLLGMSILYPMVGICVSLYFQFFVIILFWTPVKASLPTVPGYTETFLARFPVLYFCDASISMLLSLQKQYYYLKAEKQAHEDTLTGLSNRNMYIEFIEHISEKPLDKNLAVICLDVNSLKRANDLYGHEAGDEMLIAAGDLMRQCFKGAALLCRTGGDEFCVITFRGKETVDKQLNAYCSMVRAWEGKMAKSLAVSIGSASLQDHPGATVEELMHEADKLLYKDKGEYYKRTGIERRKLQ